MKILNIDYDDMTVKVSLSVVMERVHVFQGEGAMQVVNVQSIFSLKTLSGRISLDLRGRIYLISNWSVLKIPEVFKT